MAAVAAAGAFFAGAYHADAHEHERPHVTISPTTDKLMVPARVPGGIGMVVPFTVTS